MKKLFPIALLSLLFAGCASVSGPTDGLVGRWAFDGDCRDSSGHGNDGINHDVTFVADRFGNPASAAHCGGRGFVRVTNTPELESITGPVSMACWLRIDMLRPDWIPIFCKRVADKFPRQFGFQLTNDRQGLMQINDENGGLQWKKQVKSGRVPFDSRWHHYAITYDGVLLIAYVDGQEVGRVECPGELQANDEDLLIGCDPPGGLDILKGDIDDARLYNRALSAEEVKELFSLGK